MNPSSSVHFMLRAQREWIEGLLPQRDPRKTCIKLSTEVAELMEAVCFEPHPNKVGEEFADAMILLLDIAYLHGVDPERAFYAKLEKNKNRTWMAQNGSLQHTKENNE